MERERRDYYVYRWTNTVNGKCYIGKGRADRANAHFRASVLKRNRCPHFYAAVRKYGRGAFCLVRLREGLTETEAFIEEMLAIYVLEPSYNLSPGGEGCSGLVHSDESKAKIASFQRGKQRSEETRLKIAEATRMQWQDPSIREQRLKAMQGYQPTAETRARMSAAQKARQRRARGQT